MCYEREQLHAAECPYYLDRGTEKRTYNGVDFETLNEECTHAIFRQCEFEIKTNNYKLEIDENTCQDQGYLKVGKTVVSTCMIDYLEIDGRILISEEEASK
jgi:DNA topoisomerase IA